jgi:hypothetical protein
MPHIKIKMKIITFFRIFHMLRFVFKLQKIVTNKFLQLLFKLIKNYYEFLLLLITISRKIKA